MVQFHFTVWGGTGKDCNVTRTDSCCQKSCWCSKVWRETEGCGEREGGRDSKVLLQKGWATNSFSPPAQQTPPHSKWVGRACQPWSVCQQHCVVVHLVFQVCSLIPTSIIWLIIFRNCYLSWRKSWGFVSALTMEQLSWHCRLTREL